MVAATPISFDSDTTESPGKTLKAYSHCRFCIIDERHTAESPERTLKVVVAVKSFKANLEKHEKLS